MCKTFFYMHLKLQAILNKGFYYTKVIGAMLVASIGLQTGVRKTENSWNLAGPQRVKSYILSYCG
jgi:hypothetical protein